MELLISFSKVCACSVSRVHDYASGYVSYRPVEGRKISSVSHDSKMIWVVVDSERFTGDLNLNLRVISGINVVLFFIMHSNSKFFHETGFSCLSCA